MPTRESVSGSPFDALPLRRAHRAPLTDGAVALVLATDDFLQATPHCKPLARIAGAGWATDSYRLDRDRLRALNSARAAWSSALRQAGLKTAAELDAIELESQTAFHEAAYVRAFGIEDADAVSPSGSTFAQNPLFCSGLVNAAAAVLQVGGKAGAVQRPH